MPGISSYRFTHKGVENPLQGTRCFGQRSRSVKALRDKQDREQLAPDPPPMQSITAPLVAYMTCMTLFSFSLPAQDFESQP